MIVRPLTSLLHYWTRHWWPRLAFLAVILGFMITRARPAAIVASFEHVDARWLVAAAAIDASVIFLKGIDLKIIVDALGTHRVRVIEAFSATSVGLMVNWFVPARLGELARVFVLHRAMRRRDAEIPAATLLGTVVGERLFAVISLVVLLVVFLAVGGACHAGRSESASMGCRHWRASWRRSSSTSRRASGHGRAASTGGHPPAGTSQHRPRRPRRGPTLGRDHRAWSASDCRSKPSPRAHA